MFNCFLSKYSLYRRATRVGLYDLKSKESCICFSASIGSRDFSTTGFDNENRGEQVRGAMASFFKRSRENKPINDSTKNVISNNQISDAINTDSSIVKSKVSASPVHVDSKRVWNSRLKKTAFQKKEKFRRTPREGGGFESEDGIESLLLQEPSIPKGFGFDTSGMDDFDAYMADIYVKSLKSDDGVVYDIYKSPKFKTTRIPAPRSTAQLVMSMQPIFRTKPKSEKIQVLAAQIWLAVSRNIYYSETDRQNMCEAFIQIANSVVDDNGEVLPEPDFFLPPSFKKGFEGMEEEEALRLLQSEETPTEDEDELEVQEDTDWDVEAVVDEDDLFR